LPNIQFKAKEIAQFDSNLGLLKIKASMFLGVADSELRRRRFSGINKRYLPRVLTRATGSGTGLAVVPSLDYTSPAHTTAVSDSVIGFVRMF
jgi:hypothetical protein